MKKNIYLILTVLLISTAQTALAQKNDTVSFAENDYRKNYTIYHMAKRFNDPIIARMALYQMLIYARDESSILDSLALEYYSQQNYISAAIVAKDNIAINPKSLISLEIGGASLSNLGVKDQSLEMYEKLALITNNTNTYYQVAYMQFELKRFREASTTIKILLERKEIDEIKLSFSKVDKTNQEVSMRAALLNLQGLIAQSDGNINVAKNYFLEALKASPGFEIAQANLSKAGK